MFGELVVVYLFLGGAGAGAVAVACLADLARVREPFGTSAYAQGPAVEPCARLVDYGFAMGFTALFAATVCLVFDLGRADRVLSLFLNPYPTVMTVGSYALAALLAVSAALALVRLMYVPEVRRWMVVAAEWFALAAAVVVMVYTGVLLATMGGVPFWESWVLPPLFAASSAACGLAIFILPSAVMDRDIRLGRFVKRLIWADIAIIAVEAAFTAAFLFQTSNDPNPGAAAGYFELMGGRQAALWWFGFVVCGMALPLSADIATVAMRSHSRKVVLAAAVLVLAGGLCMRSALVDAGDHRAMTLGDPAVEYLEGPRLNDLTLQDPAEPADMQRHL